MKKKSTTLCTPEMQKEYFERAKTTIEVLTTNMVKPDICNSILFQYYKEVNRKSVIKLLLRCDKLY